MYAGTRRTPAGPSRRWRRRRRSAKPASTSDAVQPRLVSTQWCRGRQPGVRARPPVGLDPMRLWAKPSRASRVARLHTPMCSAAAAAAGKHHQRVGAAASRRDLRALCQRQVPLPPRRAAPRQPRRECQALSAVTSAATGTLRLSSEFASATRTRSLRRACHAQAVTHPPESARHALAMK